VSSGGTSVRISNPIHGEANPMMFFTMNQPALFMSASAAIANSRRQARMYASGLHDSTRKTRPAHGTPPAHGTLCSPGHCHLTDSAAFTDLPRLIRRGVDLATRLRDFATNRHE
jgi:hypothetical protein